MKRIKIFLFSKDKYLHIYEMQKIKTEFILNYFVRLFKLKLKVLFWFLLTDVLYVFYGYNGSY